MADETQSPFDRLEIPDDLPITAHLINDIREGRDKDGNYTVQGILASVVPAIVLLERRLNALEQRQ